MAIFQFHMQIIGRSEGRSVVAAAAYRSASKIENQYTGVLEDYSKKKWVEHSEIMLPEYAPESFHDRATLWNSVEIVEKGRNARLAREIEVALPIELSMEENIRLVQDFVRNTFVSDGMAADINIHNPPVTNQSGIPVDASGNPVQNKKDMIFRNPHAHILLTVRPFSPDGNWMAKAQKEYVCKRGNETASFTASEYLIAKKEGWQKQYQYWVGKQKVWMTASEAYPRNLVRVSKNPKSTIYGRRDTKMEKWNSDAALREYRLSWERYANRALKQAGRPERIDSRSYKDQGVDTIAGIHLGPHASRMGKNASDRSVINEEIKILNRANVDIKISLSQIEKEIKEKQDSLFDELAMQLAQVRADIISAQYSLDALQEQGDLLKQDIQKVKSSISRIQNAEDNIKEKNRLSEEKISGLDAEMHKTFPPWSKRPEEISDAIHTEQEKIQYREQHFTKILHEEGFSDIHTYQKQIHKLHQMEQEYQQLTEKITYFETMIQENIHKYKDLSSHIPEEAESIHDFNEKEEQWASRYEKQAEQHIKNETGHFQPQKFKSAIHKVDYSLGHTLYMAGRTEQLLERFQKTLEETNSDSRRGSVK